MSYVRTFVPAVMVVGMLAWALAIGQQPGAGVPKVSPIPLRDPGAQKALTDAVAALDRQKLPWIETTVWQQTQVDGLRYQANGVYLAGPDHQLHLLLKVQAGDAAGRLEVVCDGKTYWETMQIGDGDRRVLRKLDFQKVLAALNEPSLPAESRVNFLHSQFFAGVVPLLKGLERNIDFAHVEPITWQGHKVLRLSGTWNADITKAIQAQSKTWPEHTPRECRVYLDSNNHWPLRIEWLGPAAARQRDTLLFEMEFRSPRFEPMNAERVAQVFRFMPDNNLKVNDQTQQTIEMLRRVPRP